MIPFIHAIEISEELSLVRDIETGKYVLAKGTPKSFVPTTYKYITVSSTNDSLLTIYRAKDKTLRYGVYYSVMLGSSTLSAPPAAFLGFAKGF